MDAVVTYVNGLDPAWQAQYAQAVGGVALTKRYRDWGTLKYWLRGIEKHMPFIENVYLLVSGPSQVPDWASPRLKVVCHSDIIPAEHLPTFNSCTIEMFLHRIPGLSEEFIYFNDDMFPMMDCRPEDFFEDGKTHMKFSRHLLAGGLYKKQCRNSDRLASLALGQKPGLCFLRPQHSCSPMLRSESEELYQLVSPQIEASLSPLRTARGLNQYLFLDYLYRKGLVAPAKVGCKHISLAVWSAERIASEIQNPSTGIVCINDVQMDEQKYQSTRRTILDAFERKFPQKSRFEL